MKAALMSTSIPWPLPPHLRPLKPAGASSSSSQIKLLSGEDADVPPSPIPVEGAKETDIWRLFREAQKNILHLNQHRLKAVEDLNKINSEKQVLVDRIEQLELELKQAPVAKPRDGLSSCWEVLLRIDSMVLTGMIVTGEASDLRRLIMDHKVSLAEVFNGSLQKTDGQLLVELRHFYARIRRNDFHIVHICTEMAPLVSVGSVASYVTGLSCALQRKGHIVEVILPKYSSLDLDEIQGLQEIEAEFFSYFNGQLHGNRIWTGVVYGIGVTMIQPVEYSDFFNRDKVYGYSDMEGKSVCKAALQRNVGLSEHASTILIGCILSDVLDVDLENLRAAIMRASKNDVQFIIMGTDNISSKLKLGSLQESLKNEHVQLVNGCDEPITHLVFAGCDIILCQSFHDPVLQVPLKALKYGAAPIALNISYDSFRNFTEHDSGTTNFSRFISSTFGSMSISEALNEMKNHPSKWKRKILDAMEMDFSWDAECCDVHTSAYTSIKEL